MSSPVPSRRDVLRFGAAALAGALALGLSACAPDPATEAYLDGKQKAYTTKDFRVVEIPADKRGEPVTFGGTTESGKKFNSADAKGKVMVVNFWYATCGPCRVEAKDLETVWQKYQGDDVVFMGVNIYDQAATAKAFAKKYGVTFPSLMDADTGQAKLAFAKVAPIQAPPTTLVLDRQGRVAARIIGPIDGASILSTLIDDALKEKA